MSQYIYRARAIFGVALAVAFVACQGDKKPDSSALAQDSSLSRDLARVGADTAVQPALQDVPAPAVTPSAETKPAPEPPRLVSKPVVKKSKPPAPKLVAVAPRRDTTVTETGNKIERGPGAAEKSGSIAAGTTLRLDAADKVCTNTNKVGDRFIATLNEPVSGDNGAVIPSGATVTIEITHLKRSENTNDKVEMGFRVVNLSFDGKTYPLDADVQTAEIDRVRNSSRGNDAKKVAGGAAIGAIIGQILGKKTKSTIIGAAVGAAAGGAAAVATANYEGCVNSGGAIVIKLNAPVAIAAR